MYDDPGFLPEHIPSSRESDEYVAWIDIMGIESSMAVYPKIAEVNVGKLHLAVAEYKAVDNLETYPMVDGIYAVSTDRERIFEFAEHILGRFSQNLISRTDFGLNKGGLKFGPLIRCGIAKGEVHHWSDLTETALATHKNREALITGNAVSLAHESEAKAPPVGIRLHESVSGSGTSVNHKWWTKEKKAIFTRRALGRYWKLYVNGCEIPYNIDAISRHAEKADEYFPTSLQIDSKYQLRTFYQKFDFGDESGRNKNRK